MRRDYITTSSDGTRSLERDHTDEDAPDVCPICARDLTDDGECPTCGSPEERAQARAELRADRKADR